MLCQKYLSVFREILSYLIWRGRRFLISVNNTKKKDPAAFYPFLSSSSWRTSIIRIHKVYDRVETKKPNKKDIYFSGCVPLYLIPASPDHQETYLGGISLLAFHPVNISGWIKWQCRFRLRGYPTRERRDARAGWFSLALASPSLCYPWEKIGNTRSLSQIGRAPSTVSSGSKELGRRRLKYAVLKFIALSFRAFKLVKC